MEAADVWQILLGAVVALAGTLVAQWSSLAYQTRRQREARRADFQRSVLVQVRDLLLELSEAMGRVTTARHEIAEGPDWDGSEGLPSYHPVVAAVRSISDRLVIVAAAVDDEQLRIKVDQVARRAHMDAIAPTDEVAEKTRRKSLEVHREAVQLVGQQLRKLP